LKATATGFNPVYSEDSPLLEEVSSLEGLSVIEFGAPWCGHCKAAQRAIETALSSRELPHTKIYDGKGKPLGRNFKVKLWPTLILLKDGDEISRLVRPLKTDEVESFLAAAKNCPPAS
jgi:thioredoxin 1